MASIVVGTLRALLTADTAQFEAGIRRAQTAFGSLSKSTQSLGVQASQLGASLTRTLTLPILGFGGAMAKAAMDFESSFAGVRKTVNATDAELSVMAQSLRDLAKTIPVNVNELNRLAEAAGAMGIPKAEIVEFTRVMALLGVTTNVTSDQAAESIGKIQNIFASAGKETDRFAATLVALGNDGASTESQILEMATRIAGAGNVIGLTQGQVLGFASALSSVGLEAEAGGTAISRVFVDIASSVSMGGKELAQFANVAGMSTAAFTKMFKEDAAGAVLAFIEGLGRIKASGGDVLGVLAAMGIEEVRLRDTLLRAAGAGDILRSSLVLQGKAWQENSALTEEARKRFETTSSQLTLLWNRVKDVAITLGNALLPMIKATVSGLDALLPIIESVARMFVALPTPIQAVVVGLGLAVAAAGPLLFVFGQLAIAAGGIAAAFATKGLAARALAVSNGALTVSVGVLTSTFGLLALAIGAVWSAWQIGNVESVKNSIASWALSADNLTAKLFRLVTGVEKMSEAEARASVQSTASAVAANASSAASSSVASSVQAVTAALKASAPALDKNLFQTKASTEASEKAAAAKLKEAGAYRAFLNEIGEREIEAVAASIQAREAAEMTHRQFLNQLGEQEIADFGANIAKKEEQERAWRDFQNEQGLRLMDSDAAQIKTRSELWTSMTESLKRTWGTLETAIQGSFAQILLRTRSFKEAMIDIWQSIKGALVNIFADIAGAYLKQIALMAAARMGANVTAGSLFGSLFGAGAGGAAAAGGSGGAAAAGGVGISLAAGVATAGIATAAIALYWGIRHKGLFRGGAEALHVNPARDAFFDALGPPGWGAGSARRMLADRLFAVDGHGALFDALSKADTMSKLDAALQAIQARLERADREDAAAAASVASDVVSGTMPVDRRGGTHGTPVPEGTQGDAVSGTMPVDMGGSTPVSAAQIDTTQAAADLATLSLTRLAAAMVAAQAAADLATLSLSAMSLSTSTAQQSADLATLSLTAMSLSTSTAQAAADLATLSVSSLAMATSTAQVAADLAGLSLSGLAMTTSTVQAASDLAIFSLTAMSWATSTVQQSADLAVPSLTDMALATNTVDGEVVTLTWALRVFSEAVRAAAAAAVESAAAASAAASSAAASSAAAFSVAASSAAASFSAAASGASASTTVPSSGAGGAAGGGGDLGMIASIKAFLANNPFDQHRIASALGIPQSDVTRLGFRLGGFVPPGAVVPATLHGGTYGEMIIPLDKPGGAGSTRIVNQYITVQGVIDRENAVSFWREHILPQAKRALEQNTDGYLTVHQRVLA